MTRQKTFKSRIRARMDKTGESYTTARRHLLTGAAPAESAQPPSEPAPTPGAPVEPAPAAPAEPGPAPAGIPAAPAAGAGQTDRISAAMIRERTGRSWDEWFTLLDEWGGTQRTHTEIARWLVTAHEVPGWWAQALTVGYEQARGLRAPGQRRDGRWEAGGSRTVAVPVQRLFEAFADETLRRRWLPDVEIRVRTATAPKTFRADWAGGPTRIVAGFTPKGEAKAQVAVVHEKLADAEEAARLKGYWRERLAALKQLLESGN
ncbi:DUF4287 domain-containing protein [Micromonospora sp. CPCC 205556]|uniref:DUF4287 domain-containing protein n=1 Tax=Micromonospora sp. CPCC 205556 TaxID=3122398 RepID=UPI002FEF1546